MVDHRAVGMVGRWERRRSAYNQGDLAFILIGQQTAFISDLEPVVSESAVAFDPQVSVVTEGVLSARERCGRDDVLHRGPQFVGFVVTIYRRPTIGMGWDQDKWWKWY